MSTINRIEIANFLNLNGEGESEPWDPRYRALTFNFHGQSTALNMTNGVGKTSNVEAWLALLTRDPHLISRTRQKMAPERDGYYSHIRIEFIVPEWGKAAQDDFFVQQGATVAGKETWVFGMYGYRSAGSINFYYYRGTLEQVPVAKVTAGTVTLLPNQEFRVALKAAERNRHSPVREDWIAELSLHVSPVSIRRQAEYQKRGGGDKSTELFVLKSRKGEKFDVTFFYEVIAPELLSGLMDREGEEGEHEFEDTVLNAVMDVIRTRHNTVRKKHELDKVEQVLGVLDETSQKAIEAEQAQKQYEQQRTRMAQDLALLQNLVQEQPLPGTPESPIGNELIDRLKGSIIIEPGDRYYRILDAGIALLTGESVGALNQRARRAQLEGRRIAQPIVIACDSLSGTGGRTGPKPSSYAPADARDLAQSSSRWANGLTRQMSLELLDDLDSWILNDAAHRNPYRTQRNELEYDIEQLERDLATEQERRQETERELHGLHDQKTRMEADEAAYRDVQSSGHFTEDEWSDPEHMAGQVVASPSARQGLCYLEESDIAHVPLHQVIEGMGLGEDRRRKVLSCFSALLFAPVAATEEAAHAAAGCLAEHDAQIPVFMADSLKSFARDGDLKANKDREFYHGLIAGITTRAVACLLEPSLVKREKERIDGLIAGLVGEEREMQGRLRETAECAPLVVLARKAQSAVEAKAESELENHSKQLQVLEERLPELGRRASHESLQAIRAAQEFDRLGGEAKRQVMERNLQEQERLLEDLRRREKQSRTNQEVLDQEEREARKRLDSAYPFQLRTMLEQVRQFVGQGGVDFLEAVPRREQELESALERANNRKEYRQHLIRAASYLAAFRREKDGEDINGLIAQKEGQLKKVDADVERLSQDREKLFAHRKPLDNAMKAIDQVAQLAQQHYQPASQVAHDLSGTDIDRGQLESNAIFQQAEALRLAVERGYDLSEVIREAEILQDQLSQLEIERDLRELRSLKNQGDSHLTTFLGSVCEASKHEGLSDVEQERL